MWISKKEWESIKMIITGLDREVRRIKGEQKTVVPSEKPIRCINGLSVIYDHEKKDIIFSHRPSGAVFKLNARQARLLGSIILEQVERWEAGEATARKRIANLKKKANWQQ